jgi:hypothetical protein
MPPTCEDQTYVHGLRLGKEMYVGSPVLVYIARSIFRSRDRGGRFPSHYVGVERACSVLFLSVRTVVLGLYV